MGNAGEYDFWYPCFEVSDKVGGESRVLFISMKSISKLQKERLEGRVLSTHFGLRRYSGPEQR